MSSKAFFDTNVLLYLFSTADIAKQQRARELYTECSFGGRIVLSTQVVEEFFVAGLGKLLLPRQEVREVAAALLELDLIVVGPSQIRAAMDLEERYTIAFWDALIVAAAESAGAEVLYTEDLNDGERYGPVLVQNPFRRRAASD
jgi:predicted nucleic acid-binding protein